MRRHVVREEAEAKEPAVTVAAFVVQFETLQPVGIGGSHSLGRENDAGIPGSNDSNLFLISDDSHSKNIALEPFKILK